jgi:high affinity Mn2+ porin
MKIGRVFGVAAVSIILSLPRVAAGADLPIEMPLKAPAKKPSAFDWTGFYLGGHLGYATGTSKWSATQNGAAGPTLNGSLDLFNPYDPFKGTGSFFVGPQAG